MRTLISLYLFVIAHFTFAQTFVGGIGVTNTTINPREIIRDQGNITSFLAKTLQADVEVEGDPYLYDDWKAADIMLKSEQLLEGFKVKIDLIKNELDVETSLGVRALPSAKIIFFKLQLDGNQVTFVNASSYKLDSSPLSGFLQVLQGGRLAILVKIDVSILPPDYNVQMNVGNKNARIVKSERYFIVAEGSDEMKIIKSIKDILSFVEEDNRLIAENFVRQRKLKFKSKSDLVSLMTFINTL